MFECELHASSNILIKPHPRFAPLRFTSLRSTHSTHLHSVLLGQIFHAVPSSLTSGLPLDDYAAIAAFTFFGYKTLKEALDIDEGAPSGMDEELEDAKSAVGASTTAAEATKWAQIVSTFGLVFAAEFGDRSFLATIALAAAQNPISVGVGAIAGHAVATVIAVAGGR